MSFQPPNSRQGDQNRKILEDLQKKQQALKQQSQQSVGNNSSGNSSNIINTTVLAPKALPNLNTKPTTTNQLSSPTSPTVVATLPLNPNCQQYGPSDLTGNGPANNTTTPQMFAGAPVGTAAVAGSGNNQRERAALLHAHQNSYGFFIAQDSSFGNQILPVIPIL